MWINKQNTALLLSLLFAVSLSADPVLHSLDIDNDHEIIECQLCESESFKTFDYHYLDSFDLVVDSPSSYQALFSSVSGKGFSARAPPKK